MQVAIYTVQGNEIFLDAIRNTRVGKKSGIKIWSSVTDLENGSLSLAFQFPILKN